jgi:hypothetical protein
LPLNATLRVAHHASALRTPSSASALYRHHREPTCIRRTLTLFATVWSSCGRPTRYEILQPVQPAITRRKSVSTRKYADGSVIRSHRSRR